MRKSGKAISPFDLNQDGMVTLPEMEEAVKRSFSNVKHDVTELKKVQEHGLQELNRIRKDLDEFVHRDDFTASGQQVGEFVRLLEKNLHEKENKLLKHMAVLERRMSKLASLVMGNIELKSRVNNVEKQTKDFEEMMDLSHLNRKLHDEILRMNSDLLTLKHSVKDDVQARVDGIQEQLSGFSGKDKNHLFITRAELDNVADELREQQSAHISRIDQQLSTFQEHFSTVEKLLKNREQIETDLKALRTHLSAAEEFLKLEKEAIAAKEEVMKLNERVGRIERKLRLEMKSFFAREMARYEENLTTLISKNLSRQQLLKEVKLLKTNINRLKRGVKKKARRSAMKKNNLKIGLKKKPGYLYFLDKNGNAARVRMARKGKKINRKQEVLVKCGIKRKKGHLYYIDKKGNVAFTRMARGRKRKSKKESLKNRKAVARTVRKSKNTKGPQRKGSSALKRPTNRKNNKITGKKK